MTVIVAISDGGGMLFNKRRQSRDRVLIDDLMSLSNGKTLYITEFSRKLFPVCEGVSIAEDVETLPKDALLFIENISLTGIADKITKMIIYKWNKKYPADLYLDVSPESLGLRLSSSVDFCGYSHDKITREIYE